MRRMSGLFVVAIGLMLPSCAAPSVCYRTSVGSGPDEIPVVVVSGTPYEMGHALGRLTAAEARRCATSWLSAAQKEEPQLCSNESLDAAWKAIAPYTHERYKQELRGLADGSGVPYELLLRVQMIPVVSDYACSGVAAWGSATANGHLLQIRNLDFTVGAGLEDCPAIVIYRPKRGIPHASVTIAGFVGANTGMNAEGVVLGEKGESPKKERPFDLDGIHFTTLFRDLLYEARDLTDVIDRIKSAKLIKRYYFYVSGGKGAAQGAAKVKVTTPDPVPLHVWYENDESDELAPKVLESVIYNTMNNEAAYAYLKDNHGRLDPDKMIALSQRLASRNGNLLDVVYDANTLEMWVAYAEKSEHAFQRPYVHVRMTDYLDPNGVPPGAVVLKAKQRR